MRSFKPIIDLGRQAWLGYLSSLVSSDRSRDHTTFGVFNLGSIVGQCKIDELMSLAEDQGAYTDTDDRGAHGILIILTECRPIGTVRR